jgi:hypothetical protein
MSKQARPAPETEYQWECSRCGADNRVTDAQMICSQCGKSRTDERCLRHFKLTTRTGYYGHRGAGKGYTQRAGKRQRDTQELHAAIVRAVRASLGRGHTEAVAKRSAAKQLDVDIKTVRKVWRSSL